MKIEDVEKLAELARIEMSIEEKEEILKDMDSIVGYVKAVEAVDVGDIDSKHEVYNVWRDDEEEESLEKEKELITDQFPHKQAGYLKVKKIL